MVSSYACSAGFVDDGEVSFNFAASILLSATIHCACGASLSDLISTAIFTRLPVGHFRRWRPSRC